jgi:ComF family protein
MQHLKNSGTKNYSNSFVKTLFESIVDFAYPKICLISDERINSGNSNDFISDSILAKLELIKEEEFSFIRSKINADFFYSRFAFRHDNEMQTLIHYLKYKKFTKIGNFLGSIIGKQLANKYSEKLKDYKYLLPVPLFKGKQRERGYNQSLYICNGIVENFPLEILNDTVVRIKNTKSQTGLNYRERVANIQDAFELNTKFPKRLIDKGILVVDDVITTGSTAKEVIRLLKQSYSVNVGAITVGKAKSISISSVPTITS